MLKIQRTEDFKDDPKDPNMLKIQRTEDFKEDPKDSNVQRIITPLSNTNLIPYLLSLVYDQSNYLQELRIWIDHKKKKGGCGMTVSTG